jgi:hypothetical protein
MPNANVDMGYGIRDIVLRLFKNKGEIGMGKTKDLVLEMSKQLNDVHVMMMGMETAHANEKMRVRELEGATERLAEENQTLHKKIFVLENRSDHWKEDFEREAQVLQDIVSAHRKEMKEIVEKHMSALKDKIQKTQDDKLTDKDTQPFKSVGAGITPKKSIPDTIILRNSEHGYAATFNTERDVVTKVEKGHTPTAWAKSPEDYEKQVSPEYFKKSLDDATEKGMLYATMKEMVKKEYEGHVAVVREAISAFNSRLEGQEIHIHDLLQKVGNMSLEMKTSNWSFLNSYVKPGQLLLPIPVDKEVGLTKEVMDNHYDALTKLKELGKQVSTLENKMDTKASATDVASVAKHEYDQRQLLEEIIENHRVAIDDVKKDVSEKISGSYFNDVINNLSSEVAELQKDVSEKATHEHLSFFVTQLDTKITKATEQLPKLSTYAYIDTVASQIHEELDKLKGTTSGDDAVDSIQMITRRINNIYARLNKYDQQWKDTHGDLRDDVNQVKKRLDNQGMHGQNDTMRVAKLTELSEKTLQYLDHLVKVVNWNAEAMAEQFQKLGVDINLNEYVAEKKD